MNSYVVSKYIHKRISNQGFLRALATASDNALCWWYPHMTVYTRIEVIITLIVYRVTRGACQALRCDVVNLLWLVKNRVSFM